MAPVEVLLQDIFIRPHALKKYLACAALGKVIVLVIVIVHDPALVAAVLEFVPVQAVYCAPLAAALPRFVVTLVKSVLTLAKILIVLPVTGAVLDVSVVLV